MFARFILFAFFCCSLSAHTPLYVWSLGFCESADVKPLDLNFEEWMEYAEDRYDFNMNHYLNEIQEGSILWINADYLHRFMKRVVPKLKFPIVLIAGGSDATFPDDYTNKKSILKEIDSPKILHLFLQNCKLIHSKVTQIPIGIDLHSSMYWPDKFGESISLTPEEQMDQLNKIIKELKPTGKRELKAFCDFALNDSMHSSYHRYLEFGEDRKMIWEKIKLLGFATHLENRISRLELWKRKGECAFDISPPGNGIDCHRTWEALALGCIPIVKDSFLNPLFEGLPVVIVKSWNEITEENLRQWRDQYHDALTNPAYREKLLLSYWMNKIRLVQENYINSDCNL